MNYQIKTKCGEINGIIENGVLSFKGIRYARAERFKKPVLVESWDGVYSALEFGACAYQPRAFYDESSNKESAFYYNEFRKDEVYNYSEDCLFLNIWAPVAAKDAAVLFYIHGGGFVGGCGHEKHFSGEAYAKQDVILVTINYRLGPLGFICLDELEKEAGHTGNYGIFDQIAALEWIRNNIESFGGDKDKITIMGQSAGAISVQNLVLSPLTKGMYRAAIMQSGGGISDKFAYAAPASNNYDFWNMFKEQANVKTLEELREITPAEIFKSFISANKIKGQNMTCFPVIDGVLLSKSAKEIIEDDELKNIPYIMSSTSEDMVPIMLYNMAKEWAKLQKEKSYLYFFERALPGDDLGAWHSSDLWYLFGTLKNCWRPFTEYDYDLSNTLVSYIANFVKTKNPNSENLLEWPSIDIDGMAMMFSNDKIHYDKPSEEKLLATTMKSVAKGE